MRADPALHLSAVDVGARHHGATVPTPAWTRRAALEDDVVGETVAGPTRHPPKARGPSRYPTGQETRVDDVSLLALTFLATRRLQHRS